MERRAFLNVAAGGSGGDGDESERNGAGMAGEQERRPVAYPDAAIEAVDARFKQYVVGNAAVERLWTGARWAEGPVWIGDGRCLLFSDIPNNRMMRWTEETGEVTGIPQPFEFTADGKFFATARGGC